MTPGSTPWPGLAAYTEAQQALFFGRDTEAATLARMVQRSRLTLLLGARGVGKTSLLQAGLAPRLLAMGLLPVRVRIDASAEAPPPAEQVKQALRRASARHGQWSRPGVAKPDETLWECLHHRDDRLLDPQGKALSPVLLFDQFEELFATPEGDASASHRLHDFITELADLAENRVPDTLQRHAEADESVLAEFDFERCDYRVLLCLDEAQLGALATLRPQMPSLGEQRLRLQGLSPDRALAVVLGPDPARVDEATAQAIVEHLGRGEPPQIDPLQLSLLLRRLEEERLASRADKLGTDTLAESGGDELSACWQRGLAAHPEGVRHWLQDAMLTEAGGRACLPIDQVLRQLQAAGGSPQTLTALVNCGLLRIEDRLDRLQVELTHELLCDSIRRQRQARRETEAATAQTQALAEERRLAEQRLQELQAAKQRASRRARQARFIAAGALVVAGLSLAWALFARSAWHQTGQQEQAADIARIQAEALLSNLVAQSSASQQALGEPGPTGQIGERVLAYFRALPTGLRGPDTARQQALVEAILAHEWAEQGRLKPALALADDAEAHLRPALAAGERSEATGLALARLYGARSQALAELQQPEPAKAAAIAGVTALRAQLGAASAPDSLRLALADLLIGLAERQIAARDCAAAIQPLTEASALLAQLGGGPSGSHLRAAAALAEASAWRVRCHRQLGDLPAMREAAALARERAAWVLGLRPQHAQALTALAITLGELATAALGEHEVGTASTLREEQAGVFDRLLALDPGNSGLRTQAGVSAGRWAAVQIEAGRLGAAARVLQASRARLSHFNESAGAAWALSGNLLQLGEVLREQGDASAAADVVQAHAAVVAALLKQSPASDITQATLACRQAVLASDEQLAAGRPEAVPGLLQAPLERLRLLKSLSTLDATRQLGCLHLAALRQAQALAALGQVTAISVPMGEAIFTFRTWPNPGRAEQEQLAQMLVWQAWSLARQGKTAEAQSALAPALAQFRAIVQQAPQSERAAATLASMLVVQAQVEPARRAVYLAQARALWAGLSAEMQATREVRQWRAWTDGAR